MKNLRFVLAFVLVLAMTFALAACGESKVPAGNNDKPDNAGATEAATAAATEEPSGTTYDTGAFSVFVPDGWTALPVPDIFDSEKTDEYSVYLVNSDDVEAPEDFLYTYDTLYLTVSYTSPDGYYFEPTRDYYSDIEDISPVINGEQWTGFEGRLISNVIMIWRQQADGSWVQADFMNYPEDVFSDPDVIAILGSVK